MARTQAATRRRKAKEEEKEEMERPEKMVDIEEHPEAGYDTLHVRVPIPKHLLPKETQVHTKAAIREVLLAGRSLLDAAIDSLGGEGSAQTERIQVD